MKHRDSIPPRALRFLRLFLRKDLHDEVTGDLEELYNLTRRTRSRFVTRLIIWYEIFQYLRPFALRKPRYTNINPYPMYKSYFTTAFRNIVRNKLHAFINITGLSVGMAVTIIIALWIIDELSYEKHFRNYDRIGRVLQHVTNNNEIQTWRTLPWPLAEELRKNYGTDFSSVVLATNMNFHVLATEEKILDKVGVFAEPDFTRLFSLNMIHGSASAVADASTILLSASAAKAYFGDSDPLGKVITIDRDQRMTVKVGGVYEDMPPTSLFTNLDFVAAWDLLYNSSDDWIRRMSDPWRPNSFTIFVQLNDHATFEGASARIKDAKLKKVNEQLARKKPELFIHPMSRWRLYSRFENGVNTGGGIQYVWLFGIIGAFVLMMACINFMNLSTARSEKRAKEVGIRKAIGSFRSQLIQQFFSESILTAILSLVMAALFVQLFLPFINNVAGKNLTLQWTNPEWWLGGIVFCIVVGILAGSYPALYLSSIKSSHVMKGIYKAGRSATIPRKVLVTVQFAISIVLIIGTATVFLQIQHAKNRPIGYETNGLLWIRATNEFNKHLDVVKKDLENSGAITAMAGALSPTTEQWSSTSQLDWNGKDPDLSVDFNSYGGSYDLGATINWEVIAGRDFSRNHPSDSVALVLNESAVRYMGLKDPIGETIRWSGIPFTVIGVIKDIVTRSPYEPVTPTLYYLSEQGNSFVLLRINPAMSATDALAKIESVYKKYDPEVPFTYGFTDEGYAEKFGNEERIGKLSTIFSTLAIFISCLGIFGLSSFMAEQRLKEIGVRKVMGASLFDLWRLMSKDFAILVLISAVVAIPVAYVVASSWLQNYSYRTTIPYWIFMTTSAGTLVITLLTVSWHTVSAASANPAKTLRTE